jgi:hypothetical protein
VDYENLPGEGKADKARELIAYLERRHSLWQLVKMGRRLRPDISWSNASIQDALITHRKSILWLVILVPVSMTLVIVFWFIMRNQATPTSGKIQFVSPKDSKVLNPNLRWEAGQLNLSGYTLYPDMIEIMAASGTWPNFPTISYRPHIKGDFDVQVQIVFTSSAMKLKESQYGGLIVRPINARLVLEDKSFPNDWIVNSRSITDAGHGIGCRGFIGDYSSEVAYLLIERANNSWRCAHSDNGENWVWSAPKVDELKLFDKEVEVALFAFSTSADSIKVQFRDWALYHK